MTFEALNKEYLQIAWQGGKMDYVIFDEPTIRPKTSGSFFSQAGIIYEICSL